MPKWEYHTTFVWADMREQPRQPTFPPSDPPPPYAPQAMIPELNTLGCDGWELVHMEPVIVGKKQDVCLGENSSAGPWTNAYFCVFKRPVG